MFYTKMIRHLGKPQIRKLEIVIGCSIRSMVCYDKYTKTEYIGVKEDNPEIFRKRVHIFEEFIENEKFKLSGIYAHNNKKSYLFSRKIK